MSAPAAEDPHELELPSTKRVLAAELGTVSETLSRMLAKFREQGLIGVEGNHIRVHSPKRLRAVLLRNLGERD